MTGPDAPLVDDGFDLASAAPASASDPGGRRLLGSFLALLALAWIGYVGWSAGRALTARLPDAPFVAQWVATAAGPLALMGLVWLIFGRTRRREAEAFTRSVIAMRREARALHDLLGALSVQIGDSHRALGVVTGELVGLGDEASQRLGQTAATLQSTSEALRAQGDRFDQAATAARADMAQLMDDLPRAHDGARAISELLADASVQAMDRAAAYRAEVERLGEASEQSRLSLETASDALRVQTDQLRYAGDVAATRLRDVATDSHETIERLMSRTAEALEQVRGGIDQQSLAVRAMLDQVASAIGVAGVDAAARLGDRLNDAGSSLDSLSARVAEQERTAQRFLADLDASLAALDQQFASFAAQGDARAATIGRQLHQLRSDLAACDSDGASAEQRLAALGSHGAAVRDGIADLARALSDELQPQFDNTIARAERLQHQLAEAQPGAQAIAAATSQASHATAAIGEALDVQQGKLDALVGGIEGAARTSGQHLGELSAALDTARGQAERLAGEAAPAMIDALSQVRDTAARAAERAREAIHAVIPEAADGLGMASRAVLEQAIRDAVTSQMAEVEAVAVRALLAARGASERLTQQMITIGQAAGALEDHVAKVEAERRAHDSDQFSRRVELLIDSMHSASIDVAKILSDEVDDKAWANYLKGNRGIFTRRAARLAGSSEARSLAQHYDSDPEFQQSANRFVHDFEALLRRVLDQGEGGLLQVALMGSDLGKLYAALAPVVEKRL